MKHVFNTIIVAAMVIWAGIQPAAAQTKRMAVTALSENMMRALPDYESALETHRGDRRRGRILETGRDTGTIHRMVHQPRTGRDDS